LLETTKLFNQAVNLSNKMTTDNSKVIATAMQSKQHSTRKLTTEAFVQRAMSIHGDRYDYSLVKYKNLKTPVKIKCKAHGVFEMSPVAHIFQKSNCQKCAINKRSNERKLTLVDFKYKALKIHGEKYDYSLVCLVNVDTKVKIKCHVHGLFEQSPYCHLNRKQGCPLCADKGLAHKSNLEKFVLKANKVHGKIYTYKNAAYVNSKTKLAITCTIHGDFWQAPADHVNGKQGCPLCAAENTRGWSRSEYVEFLKAKGIDQASLYIVKCFNDSEVFLKVGITYQSIKERYRNKTLMPYTYSKIVLVNGESGFIWDLEKRIHRLLTKYSYQPSLDFGGQTECFSFITDEVYMLIENLSK
jgi:hypothetical protein